MIFQHILSIHHFAPQDVMIFSLVKYMFKTFFSLLYVSICGNISSYLKIMIRFSIKCKADTRERDCYGRKKSPLQVHVVGTQDESETEILDAFDTRTLSLNVLISLSPFYVS